MQLVKLQQRHVENAQKIENLMLTPTNVFAHLEPMILIKLDAQIVTLNIVSHVKDPQDTVQNVSKENTKTHKKQAHVFVMMVLMKIQMVFVKNVVTNVSHVDQKTFVQVVMEEE